MVAATHPILLDIQTLLTGVGNVQQAELSMISDATVTDVAGEILLETLLEIPSGSADTFLSRIIYDRVIVQEQIATLHRVCAHPL